VYSYRRKFERRKRTHLPRPFCCRKLYFPSAPTPLSANPNCSNFGRTLVSRQALHYGRSSGQGSLHLARWTRVPMAICIVDTRSTKSMLRKQVLNGKQVHYIPGWDYHGLPTELKVLQTMKQKERELLTPVTPYSSRVCHGNCCETVESLSTVWCVWRL
jgi:hypothetical protein